VWKEPFFKLEQVQIHLDLREPSSEDGSPPFLSFRRRPKRHGIVLFWKPRQWGYIGASHTKWMMELLQSGWSSFILEALGMTQAAIVFSWRYGRLRNNGKNFETTIVRRREFWKYYCKADHWEFIRSANYFKRQKGYEKYLVSRTKMQNQVYKCVQINVMHTVLDKVENFTSLTFMLLAIVFAFILISTEWQLVTFCHDDFLYCFCLLIESNETINQSISQAVFSFIENQYFIIFQNHQEFVPYFSSARKLVLPAKVFTYSTGQKVCRMFSKMYII